jgi:hypothetical protein
MEDLLTQGCLGRSCCLWALCFAWVLLVEYVACGSMAIRVYSGDEGFCEYRCCGAAWMFSTSYSCCVGSLSHKQSVLTKERMEDGLLTSIGIIG